MHRGGVNGRAFVEVFLKEHKLPAPCGACDLWERPSRAPVFLQEQ